MSTNPHDRIIVAGGGPTGLIAALSLATQDIPVLLLEQQHAQQDHRRASTFHPPTLEYLDALGMVDAVLNDGRVTPVWQFRDRHTGVIALEDVRLQTIRNTRFIAEKDPAERLKNQDEMRATAEDPQKSFGFMMGSSMIGGLRAANALD